MIIPNICMRHFYMVFPSFFNINTLSNILFAIYSFFYHIYSNSQYITPALDAIF